MQYTNIYGYINIISKINIDISNSRVTTRGSEDQDHVAWWGLDKVRHIVHTALLVRVQR